MPAVYERPGVRFAYPDNWELQEADNDESITEVTVRSPKTAFWSLTVYRGPRDHRELLDQALQAMQAEYPDAEYNAVDQQIDPASVGYELRFLCLDFTNTAYVHVFAFRGDTCLLLCQAEDHEIEAVEPVFRAMTISLLRDGQPAV